MKKKAGPPEGYTSPEPQPGASEAAPVEPTPTPFVRLVTDPSDGRTRVLILARFHDLIRTATIVDQEGDYRVLEPVDLEAEFNFAVRAGVEDPPCL